MGKVATLLVLVVISAAALRASWLSDVTGIHIDSTGVDFATPRVPLKLQQLLDVEAAAPNPALSAAVQAIRRAKQDVEQGCRPIPADVQSRLRRFFPSDVLAGTCYNTFSARYVGFNSAILRHLRRQGAAALENVVVFNNPGLERDVRIWIHELQHVIQYRAGGSEGSARLYTPQGGQLESDAASVESAVFETLSSGQDSSRSGVKQ
jgi:Domain of unknown function (DUF4157)